MDTIRADLEAAASHHAAGRLLEAEILYRKALAAAPDRPEFADAHCRLGYLLSQTRRHDEAIVEYQKAIALQPDHVASHFYRAMATRARGDFRTALDQLRYAIELDGSNLHARNQFAAMLTDTGDVAGALEQYRALLRLDPTLAGAHSNILIAMHCLAETLPDQLFEEHVRFGKMHTDSIDAVHLLADFDRNPDRRLRIGYVSPDLREHSVAAFIAPVLANHDRERFEIFAYADLPKKDEVTKRLTKNIDRFVDITGWPNAQVAEQIQHDRVDILIDLAGHTSGNRLFVFAREPALVQATWIGYPDTAGVKAIDYRLVDAITDPPPEADERHVERLVRLPGCFLCYMPPTEPIEPGPLPLETNDFVTFGAFNRMAKVSAVTLDLWAKVLARVQRSKLLLKGDGLTPATAPIWLDRLSRHGIDPSRVEPLERCPTKLQHLKQMRRVDIALDTFPYNGTTMTCEWLWMGVPLINLAGQTHVSRVGKSLLTATGLPELSADTPNRYVDLAVEYATNTQKLAELRRSLRSRLLQSPLTDAPAFTRHLENAYREKWHAWCAKPT